jgi:hypothetical protein
LLVLESGRRVKLGRDNLADRLRRLAVIIQDTGDNGRSWQQLDLTVDRNYPAM